MIIFTNHAKDRMIERGISRKDIESAIINPDNIHREFNNKVIVQKK